MTAGVAAGQTPGVAAGETTDVAPGETTGVAPGETAGPALGVTIRHLTPADREWAGRLAHLQHPPHELWVLGGAIPTAPAVAVVGSRRATVGGLAIAERIGAELAACGITVVSGMAAGIDGAAHRGCLDAGGTTVAVLGCGIDICYPPRHAPLRDRIASSGCVLTEEPPGMEPFKSNFPKRNRIIAALALAVVVVEGTARSGALSTARWAADLGREVLAVPGSILSRQSQGTNLLIRDGVRPYLGLDDLLDAVPALPRPLQQETVTAASGSLAPTLAAILRAMGPDPVHPDSLCDALDLSVPVLAARLATLELAGRVRSLPGGLVTRTLAP